MDNKLKEKLFVSEEESNKLQFYNKVMSENRLLKKDIKLLIKCMNKLLSKYNKIVNKFDKNILEIDSIKKEISKHNGRICDLWSQINPNKTILKFYTKTKTEVI